MPRWNNSLNDNCTQVMETVIKNIEPNTYQTLLTDIAQANIKNSKKEIEKYVRTKLGLVTSDSRHTRNYWILRGWSTAEAYVKAKENKQKNCKSVYSQEFWLEKINPATNKHYLVDEADFERNSRRPIKKEYWIKKGYSNSDAQDFAACTKESNNKKGASASADSTVRKISSKRCLEYYTARGASKDEAKKLVSANQKHFSKEICIARHGKTKGLEIWQDRQDSWQATLNAKTDEEKARINKLKLTKGISVSVAEREIINEIRKVDNSLPIIAQLTLAINSKKQYVYDIAVANKIIEYNGDFWHCNPKIYPPEYVNPRTKLQASEKWILDKSKIEFAKQQGYEVLVVWERDFKNNREGTIQQCIQFLKQ